MVLDFYFMFDTSAAISEVLLMISYVGGIIAGVISAILGLVAALVGLGWGIRKFLKWITGSESGGLTYEMESDLDIRERRWHTGGNEM